MTGAPWPSSSKARLINRELGQYKAWEIEAIEMPEDPEGRLHPEVWDA